MRVICIRTTKKGENVKKRISDVNRVIRQKMLWISLITMLLAAMPVCVVATPVTRTKLYIDPSRVPGPGQTGSPGDEFNISVEIRHVEDLCACSVTVKIAPFASVLVASAFAEGDFTSEGGTWPTAFYASPNIFEGTVTFVIMRLGPPGSPGVSGSGTLVTFKLTVVEAGDSRIDIVDSILLNCDGEPISHQTRNSYYYGATATLVRVEVLPSRHVKAGETITFKAKVRNDSPIPLYVRVRFDISRAEDGRRIVLYTGQTYLGGGLSEPRPFEYLYVNEFSEWYYEWHNPPEYLFGEPDDLYIWSDTNGQWAAFYSFEDIALAGREIADITLEGYTQYPNGPDEGIDIDVYGFSSVHSFAWLGSLWGTASWGWHGVRWTSDSVLDVMPELKNESELNGLQILLYNYHGDVFNVMRLDSSRLKVEFLTIVPEDPPSYLLGPHEEADLEAYWVSKPDHIGSYQLTATVEYTATGDHWIQGNQKTLFFWIVDP